MIKKIYIHRRFLPEYTRNLRVFTSRETGIPRGIGGKQTFLILRIMLGSLKNTKMSNGL